MDLEFTVTETITRHHGQLDEINYDFEEVHVESVSLGITQKKERRSRIYTASITRRQYHQIAQSVPDALTFDEFVQVLRPFILGFYEKYELEHAFSILDRDRSGTI